ncbi:MAG: hypothetical protein GY694_20105, partial [Gammaproteobacteria bacterium]|nr:hypothetical protein [Gammaproteobacteria bacterium]
TRKYAKRLVHKSIDTTLKLIGFICLYFYTLLEPLYDPESGKFKNTTRSKTQKPRKDHSYNPQTHPRPKPRKRNSLKRKRHWKMGKYPPWKLTNMLVKIFVLTKIFLHSTEDLYWSNLNRKLYNLVHNIKFVNQRGNAYPVKKDNIVKNRRRIHNLSRRDHRKRKKLKKGFLEGAHYLLNLRFLPQVIKNAVIKLAEALTSLVRNIAPQATNSTAQGPRTHCPICTIPVIGVLNYLKQNFKNMTTATLVAATNKFYIYKLTTITLKVTQMIIKKTLHLMITPFRRMRIGK